MYPEIMVIPMREELTRLGIEELRTAESSRSRLKRAARYGHGRREFDLRMRCRPHAPRGSFGSAECQSS